MNAPEKIYLQENTTTDCYGEFWPEWFEARARDSDIEYTRTDAIIEKACNFIREHHHEFYFWDTKEYKLKFNTQKFIDDFKKYMKE